MVEKQIIRGGFSMKRSINKSLAMASAAIISAVVMAVTATAAVANVSGYEALKQSVFATLDITDNYTLSYSVELFANDSKVFSRGLLSQLNVEQGASFNRSEGYVFGQGSFWGEDFRSNGLSHRVHSFNPNEYILTSHISGIGNPRFDNISLTDNQTVFLGVLMDLAVGDARNFFTMEGNTISVSLSRNQIPELIQSFITVVAEASVSYFPHYAFANDPVINILSQYLHNPVLESGTMTAVLSNEGFPAELDARIDFSTRDDSGNVHYAHIIFNAVFSDVGSTEVRLFDPEGKTRTERFSSIYEVDPPPVVHQSDIDVYDLGFSDIPGEQIDLYVEQSVGAEY